ncbi:MAG: hypothetical protein ACKN89_00090, partial [Cyanobium sp.]
MPSAGRQNCTDTSDAVAAGGEKEPWLRRKTRSIQHLPTAPILMAIRSTCGGASPFCRPEEDP